MTPGRFFIRFALSTVVAVALLLWIDPQYFDQPLAEGEAGLSAQEAPVGPFATLVGVDIVDSHQMVSVFLKPRDVSLPVQAEFLDPNGNTIMTERFHLASDTAQRRGQWAFWAIVPRGVGKHAIRISQGEPGRIALYFYQGPFWARILLLPLFVVLANIVILLARPKRAPVGP